FIIVTIIKSPITSEFSSIIDISSINEDVCILDNVRKYHHCKCSLETIVCHRHKCPILTCIHMMILSGHCCPIYRDQLSFINDPVPIFPSRFSFFNNHNIFYSYSYSNTCYYYSYIHFI
ncbi:unnamed protein product, partial [Rotaria sp. Silwood1]